jgi:hypothetical protein
MWSLKENTIYFLDQPIAHFNLAFNSKIKPRELRKMMKRAMKDLNEHAIECSNKVGLPSKG